jgi:hypothetical protein
MSRHCLLTRSLTTLTLVAVAASAMAQPAPTDPPAVAAPPAAEAPPAATTNPVVSLADSLTGPAKTEYDLGKILYRDGDFAGAVVKFYHAFELANDPRLLWNIAACEKNLRRYVRVLALLERYKAEGKDILTEADQQEAQALIDAIKPFISTVTIVANEPDAEVSIDGQPVGKTPLSEPLKVDMGSRLFKLAKPGFGEQTQTAKLAGASVVTLNFQLTREVHQGTVVIKAGAKDIIALDGKVVGTGRYEGVLPSGGHTLRVTASGMHAYQSELLIKDNERRNISVILEKEKASATPWLIAGGGALVVAGAVVGGYFLFKPDEKVTPGTISPGKVQVKGFTFGGL